MDKEITDKKGKSSDMTSYELTILLHTYSVADIAMSNITKKIEQLGGVVNKQECEGEKKLAFVINGEDYANYFYLEISLPYGKHPELTRWLDTNRRVLRYLLFRADTY